MSHITNHLPTSELQALDAAYHMHPFTSGVELAKKGARVITRADGVWLTDSDGNQLVDAMAGLACSRKFLRDCMRLINNSKGIDDRRLKSRWRVSN